ncbi:MAG: DUF3795 domain-containing protein [Spirochaetales bacterium]|nr:DUF3795 domain-containing protein [Spirochaetales bacterium]
MKTHKKQTHNPLRPSAVRMNMIAACGINCALCIGHHRDKRQCPGCRQMDTDKPNYCRKCVIRTCPQILNSRSGFCFECTDFPCKRIRNLDKRYRQNYGVSIVDNLLYIKTHGKQSFIRKEKAKWTCPQCGSLFSMHREICLTCTAQNKWKGQYSGEKT